MSSAAVTPEIKRVNFARHPLEATLRGNFDGEILFGAADRGRYATDASIYQIMPVGVVVPRTAKAAAIAMQIAAEAGVPILPRGAGTSQCGQTVGAALVIDNSKYLNGILDFDPAAQRIRVEPGMVLDHLNARLKKHGLWYPVDVSTSAQATIGGMAGNNSCGSRSIVYGNMVHNVAAIDAILADGCQERFGEWRESELPGRSQRFRELASGLRQICEREHDEIAKRFPPLLRRVAGYNLDIFAPRDPLHYHSEAPNLAHMLVGSEGTLAYFQSLYLKLSPLPAHKTLGVVNFPSFHQAMDSAQHIVKLGPSAVELVDRTMIELARNNPAFRPVIDAALIGEPDAILLVEFSGDEEAALVRKLDDLDALMGDLVLSKSVVKMTHAGAQKSLWDVRKAGLNIMMSMKGEGKPVSFIEDCCVPLEHLADYTRRLTEVFEKNGTRGTWYAHASVGTLHVRPILNMKSDGAQKMRAIAEEAAELVREYKGVYSGEHGDGLVRSEWIAPFFGPKLTQALGEIKALFDPDNLMNPGKIVRPSKQDERSLFRFPPGYATPPDASQLDWRTDFGERGLAAAAEMCNNNGHCRKFDAGTMCPSYRVTRDETHLTRGRANTLRQALSGQIAGGLAGEAVREAMDLCVGCKGCKRECPTGVDMAKMKIEYLHQYKKEHGYSLRDRLVAYLPRYAPWFAKVSGLINFIQEIPGTSGLRDSFAGFSAKRTLPRWSKIYSLSPGQGERARVRGTSLQESGAPHPSLLARGHPVPLSGGQGVSRREVALFADTFNNYFESENLRAAMDVLQHAGYEVHITSAKESSRPLCCGRTFLATGMIAEAKKEARRTLDALKPYVEKGVPIVGLEPSCLLTLRDEFAALFPGEETRALAAQAFLFEEFLVREKQAGRLQLRFAEGETRQALLHGHCHQKAFGVMGSVEEVLSWIPGLSTTPIESSCCGMAGAFGYEAEHYEVSMAMGELSLLPAVRSSPSDTLIVADGTSCRHQIHDGTQRAAQHVAVVLAAALQP